jgi:hypothetical protein
MAIAIRTRVCAGLLSLAVVLVPGIALGDFEATVKPELSEFDADRRDPGHTHLGRGLIDRALENNYDAWREEANESLGLDWAVAWSYLYQQRVRGGGKNNRGGRNEWTNNSELDFLVNWDLVDSDRFGKGSLTYMLSYVWEKRNYTGFGSGATTDEVTDSAGSVFTISDSDNLDARVRQLYWTQSMLKDRFQLMVGQIEVPAFVDDNSYANNDRDKFIAEVWTKSTRSTVNVFGLGAAVGVTPSENYYLRAGFIDGNTNGENPKWSSFKKGEYIYVGELGFTPTIKGWGKGVYRLSPWYADRAKLGKQGKGINISIEQETPWDMALWLRGGVSDNRRNAFETFLGGGAVFTNPFGFNRDQIGLALGWGQPDDNQLRDHTYLFEGYWRLQVTERLEFTPDIQLHMQPAKDRDNSVNVVGSLRAMFRF